MGISLLVPTRKRFNSLERMWRSAQETSIYTRGLELCCYIDDDDEDTIKRVKELNHCNNIVGERIVHSQMTNELAKIANNDIVMYGADDIVFKTNGWDEMVYNAFEQTPDKILLVYGDDLYNGWKLGTHGFLHKNWISVLGYCFPGVFSSDFGDAWVNDVADRVGRKQFLPFITEHYHYSTGKSQKDDTMREKEARLHRDRPDHLYLSMEKQRKEDAEKLKKYIEAQTI